MEPRARAGLARRLRRAAVCGLAVPSGLLAQDSTRTSRSALPAVRVTATREGPRLPLELPYATDVIRPDSLAALRRLGVDELLFTVPGVSLANRQNPAQDPRVSIRGFGARSAFGVRGVRVLQDGVPVTLPDGQTPVDALDLEGAERVEVVRGSASSLYGNAAGGVIDVRSTSPSPLGVAPFARVVGGGASPTVSALGAGGTIEPLGYGASLTRVVGGGWRRYSDQRATRAALRLMTTRPDAATSYTLAARVSDVTLAQSPGALTLAQFEADPRQPDPLSVQKQAGKTVRQEDLSLTVDRAFGTRRTLSAILYGSARTLANPLTFATVDVDRRSGGASLRLSDAVPVAARIARLALGVDAQWQHDERRQFANCADAAATTAACPTGASLRGVTQRDQLELVSSVGPFLRAEMELAPALLASAGVRADAVRFQVRDHLITPTNPDDSGDRTLHALSPALGLVWRAAPLASLYANLSTSFETPTTTELGNSPDGSAGFNPDLQPQRTLSVEVGSKGFLPFAPVRWDAAVFQSRVRDELVPFMIPGGAGRVFYRNAGRTLRRGAELGLQADAGPLGVQAEYTYSRFRYLQYTVGSTSYAGNRIPGVPEQTFRTALSLRQGVVTWSATADVATAMDVDDANSAQARGRTVLGVGATGSLRYGDLLLAPMVAVQNLGGVRYAGSVALNATGGKYYEPAPGRLLLVRLALSRAPLGP